jgi:hypothetical protein
VLRTVISAFPAPWSYFTESTVAPVTGAQEHVCEFDAVCERPKWVVNNVAISAAATQTLRTSACIMWTLKVTSSCALAQEG